MSWGLAILLVFSVTRADFKLVMVSKFEGVRSGVRKWRE